MGYTSQAGILSRLTQRFSLELESFRERIQGNQMLAGMYAEMLDLRYEPLYHAAEMSRRALREEVIGRLVLVRDRHTAAGRIVPGAEPKSPLGSPAIYDLWVDALEIWVSPFKPSCYA